MGFNAIDIAFIATMAYGLYKAYDRYFLSNITGFLQLSFAIILALLFSDIITDIFQAGLRNVRIRGVKFDDSFLYNQSALIIFILTAISFYFGIIFAGRAIEDFLEAAIFDGITRIIGLLLWLFLLALGFSTMLRLASDFIPEPIILSSLSYPYVEPIFDIVSCKITNSGTLIAKIFTAIKEIFTAILNLVIGTCKSILPA